MCQCVNVSMCQRVNLSTCQCVNVSMCQCVNVSYLAGLGNWAPEAGGTSRRNWGNRAGPATAPGIRTLCKNPLGKPS